MGNKILDHFKQMKKSQLIIEIILMVIAFGCVVYLGYFLYHQYKMEQLAQSNVTTEAVTTEIKQPTESIAETETSETEIPIDFDALHEQNKDIYAWIEVPGTDINYPILQSKTENYYLNRNLDGSSGLPGRIYTNACNEKDFSSYHTVIYGHNMKNGTMFAGLHKFEDKTFFDENQKIIIYTQDGEMLTYQIYTATAYSDAYLTSAFDPSTSEGMLLFIDSIKSGENAGGKQNIREDMKITSKDKLLTLSTCIAGQDDKRYLVIGVLQPTEK